MSVITYEVRVSESGKQSWYLNDKLHREDGPAIIRADGSQSWCLNDKLHREDGPAIISANGTEIWCLNDKLHREDGPAIISANGTQEWWLNGIKLTEEEFNSRNEIKELSVAEIEKLLGYKIKVVDKSI